MSDFEQIKNGSSDFLKRRPNNKPVKVEGADDELEALGAGATEEPFSVFNPSHQQRAANLVQEFIAIADGKPDDDGLEAVLERAKEVAEEEDIELAQYALRVFIIRYPKARRLTIPPLAERSPQKIAPSQREKAQGLEPLGGLGDEAKLDYLREDTALNEHHDRWHDVFPGHPGTPLRKRQGELFWYMHQQMLARYDIERLSFGLSKTQPLADYFSPIAEGYQANLPNFSDRSPNVRMRDLPGYSVQQHNDYREKLERAASSGYFENAQGDRTRISNEWMLADTIESNQDAIFSNVYGSLHNMGHGLIARLIAPGSPNFPGVMRDPATAMRDPVFYRWHRHVDDIYVGWQETLPANNFAAAAPPVIIRKDLNDGQSENQSPDILLCLQSAIPEASQPDFDGQTYGEQMFGGANWGNPLASFPVITNRLSTTIRQQLIEEPDGTQLMKDYLDFDEFYYFIRLENASAETRKITVRIFLTAETFTADRRMWIEMDKFPYELTAHQKAVVFRPARLSSVVRKPARRPHEPAIQPPPGTVNEPECECGWAYHLLLPRGTEAGLDFRLFVMVSDWNIDSVSQPKKCGSMSFCGAKDQDYPDKRPMGYPFDRKFETSIADTVKIQQNMATRDLKIKFAP